VASKAHRSFNKTMKRVDGLVALHPIIHGAPGRPAQHVSDVLRGALVLAMAGLDALVLDSIAEVIPQLSRSGKLGPTVEKWVRDDPGAVLACFAAIDPHESLGVVCRDRLGHQTFQRSAAIEGVLHDVIGVTGLWDEAVKNLAKQGKTLTADEVAARLDVFVERRNRIAHSGDAKPGATATAPIRRRFVIDAALTTRAVGQAVVKLVAARARS
jgi:hypothetical protein